MLTKNDINIIDLPDEMLLSIINKLNNIDILYSLVDVNQRFDRLTLNSLYFHDLDFTAVSMLDPKSHEYSKLINRICENSLASNLSSSNQTHSGPYFNGTRSTYFQLSSPSFTHTCLV